MQLAEDQMQPWLHQSVPSWRVTMCPALLLLPRVEARHDMLALDKAMSALSLQRHMHHCAVLVYCKTKLLRI